MCLINILFLHIGILYYLHHKLHSLPEEINVDSEFFKFTMSKTFREIVAVFKVLSPLKSHTLLAEQ